MKKILLLIFLLSLCVAPSAQTRKPVRKTTTAQRSTSKTAQTKKTTTKKTTQTTKKTATTAKKKTSAAGKTTAKETYSNAEIKGLQKEQSKVQKTLKEQETKLRANQANVKKGLDNLIAINSDIEEKKKSIVSTQKDLSDIDNNIALLEVQIETLRKQLDERKAKYKKSLRYMARHRGIQDRMMFIFSADNLVQMYRRMRFAREYAAYQKTQGQLVKAKQDEIEKKNQELQDAKKNKTQLLSKNRKDQASLESKEVEQKAMVQTLQKEQKTIQAVIEEQKKKNAALNSQIDRLIEAEVVKARARAAAEAKRIAEIEERKKREAEIARKKKEAEKAAAEEAKRLAKMREAEAEAKRKVEAAAKKSAEEKARAEQRAREAEAKRVAAERKAEADKARREKEIADARKSSPTTGLVSSVDQKLSGSFESNRGRLPVPITGSYKIVSHYGQYNVEGLSNVVLDNKGINIQGTSGCSARSIFEGEVSAVFSFSGSMVVMVRHGSYISVYCNLSSVSVSKGQHVAARQVLGQVGSDHILQFQLRKETSKLNPEAWIGR